MTPTATKQILSAAVTLPAGMARRVAKAIQAKEDPRARKLLENPIYDSAATDDFLEAAAAAMQSAVEAELLPMIESLLTADQ